MLSSSKLSLRIEARYFFKMLVVKLCTQKKPKETEYTGKGSRPLTSGSFYTEFKCHCSDLPKKKW